MFGVSGWAFPASVERLGVRLLASALCHLCVVLSGKHVDCGDAKANKVRPEWFMA